MDNRVEGSEEAIPKGVWRVGDHEVDTDALSIDGPSGTVSVEPMVMDVLGVLIAANGQVVSRSDLIDRVWKTEYGSDERLTRAISLLRKAFGDSHGVRNTIETVPRRGYRLIAEAERLERKASGAIAAATPAPRVAPNATSAGDSRASRPAPPIRLAWMAGALALAAVAVFALSGVNVPGETPPEAAAPGLAEAPVAQGRVEVGQFDTVSSDPAIQSLVNSMPANMTAILSEAGIETAAVGAAQTQGAEFRVRGQVEETGEVYRAFIELFDTSDGVVIWSDAFERPADGLSHVPNQMGATTAWILRCALDTRGDDGPLTSEAFRRYARFCAAMRDKGQMSNLPAFTRDIFESEPHRATAVAVHGWALTQQLGVMYDDTPERAALREEAIGLARRSVEIDPENPFANMALAAALEHTGEQVAAIERLEMASLSPTAPTGAIVNLAAHYRRVGRIEDARGLLARALAIDPYDVYTRTEYGLMTAILGQRVFAHRQLDRAMRDNPDWWGPYWRKLQIDLFDGDAARGLAYLAELDTDRLALDDDVVACARVFGEERLNETPDIDRMAAACPETVMPDWRVRMFAALGDLDRAYKTMAEFPDEMRVTTAIFFYPEMDDFRRDERFWPLAARFGLVDYWTESKAWPDFCRRGDLDFDCRRRARQVKRAESIQ